jgi:hypothetical protein
LQNLSHSNLLECAALLRFFGVRAVVVDITSEELKYGKLDSHHSSSSKFDTAASVHVEVSRRNYVQENICIFLQKYFLQRSASLLPLFFQHMGHSRTIIGVQTDAKNTKEFIKNVLMLDPGCDGELMKRNLIQKNNYWRKQLFRSVSSLKESSFQIVYIISGIMTPVEKEKSKLLIGVSPDSDLKVDLL